MTNSKKNVVKVLEAQMENTWSLYNSLKEEGATEAATVQLKRAGVLQEAIWLLTDKNYFNEIAEIYSVTE